MTWVAALTTGAGAGLAYFIGLWLTVRQVIRRPHEKALLAGSRMARLGLVGLVFFALSKHGAGILLAGLAGFWIARLHLICRLGGESHDQ